MKTRLINDNFWTIPKITSNGKGISWVTNPISKDIAIKKREIMPEHFNFVVISIAN